MIPLSSIRRVILNRHLRRVRRAEQGIREHAPGVRVPVLGDGLDEVAVGSAHADPEGGIAVVVAGGSGEN